MHNPDTSSTNDSSFLQRFYVLTGCFILLLAASIPTLLSFRLWVWQDRSSFLNLDYLLADHYRLGVDAYYSYGLLPVLLQHLAFEAFGRSYKPMIGFTLIALVLSALFWALLLEHLPQSRFWLPGVAALTPLILWVNPNFPYTIAVLSMLFAMLFVLKQRLDVALAVSTFGCFAVPSLPMELAVLLAALIAAAWWLEGDRRPSLLARQLAPGVVLYGAMAGVLALFFGVKSVAVTALPIAGVKFYQNSDYGKIGAFLGYLHPPGQNMKFYAAYYTASPVTWFFVCTLLLTVFAARAFAEMVRRRQISPRESLVFLAGLLQLVFVLVAYGSHGQHAIYQPVLLAGILVGISLLPSARMRHTVLTIVLVLGVLGEAGQAYKTYVSWRETRAAQNTLGLYEDPTFAAEWSAILRQAGPHKILVLSYGTGVHNYYSQVESPKAWFLFPGQLYPADMQRLLGQIQQANIVVEELTTSSAVVDYDPQIQALLMQMHQTSATDNFRVWQRDAAAPAGTLR